MLTQLTINNFAIVRSLDIEFKAKMTVITGETGVGKSIAIDALGLCLGDRVELGMLRTGCQRADISATFILAQNNNARTWLIEHELQNVEQEEECIIRRIINNDGRSKAFINNMPVSVSQLKELSQYLVHLQGQHSQQQLLKSEYQLALLDNYIGHLDLIHNMQTSYSAWKQIQQQLQELEKLNANEARKQLLEYQVAELNEFGLVENEYEQLEEAYKKLVNSEQLLTTTQATIMQLTGDDAVNIVSMLYNCQKNISQLQAIDPEYSSVLTMLAEAEIQIKEASTELNLIIQKIEENPEQLNFIEQRISQANILAKKHRIPVADLVNQHQVLLQELNEIENYQAKFEQLITEEKLSQAEIYACAEHLHASRVTGAKQLAASVCETIKQLAMPHAEFYINIQPDKDKITANGFDNVSFTLKSNLGQEPQLLAKIASGGELSRISLAIQVLTANQRDTPTLIFDEVDVGISGATATVVGQLLRQLSQQCQVICVTHLPQVACYGQHHFMVEKNVVGDTTETKIEDLDPKQRIVALAKLLGGKEVTPLALANAEEMLSLIE